ncbi:hypothetical protein HDU98_006685, partial [Podochytrium sp. JEL0797]
MNSPTWTCSECYAIFTRHTSLVRHQGKIHPFPETPFEAVDDFEDEEVEMEHDYDGDDESMPSDSMDVQDDRNTPSPSHTMPEVDDLNDFTLCDDDDANAEVVLDSSESEFDDADFNGPSDDEGGNPDDFGDDYRPFDSEVEAKLFVLLFGAPRRMSVQQMKVLWAIFKLLDVVGKVPSLESVLSLRKKIGAITPEPRTTSSGATVYVRPVRELIKRVFASELAQFVHRKPEPSRNPKEMFETKRYAELCPVVFGDWDAARLYAGDTVFLGGASHQVLSFDKDRIVVVVRDAGGSLRDVVMVGPSPIFVQGDLSRRANGREAVVFPTGITTDETSGNKTKRYNLCENMFVYFPALGRRFHTSAFINFAGMTKNGTYRDVAEAVLRDFMEDGELSLGVVVWDSSLNRKILVVSNIYNILADNPRHFAICSLAGSTAKRNCRFCEALKGEMDLASPRTRAKTLLALQRMDLAVSKADKVLIRVETGVAIPAAGLPNPYLSVVNLDPHKQSPIDPLHSLSLGVIKHAARFEKKVYSKDTVAGRQLRIAVGPLFTSVTQYRGDHFVAPYQFQHYVGSMYAKDFKFIAQIAPFLYIWLSWERRGLWIALSALSKLAYDTHYTSADEQATLIGKASKAVQVQFQIHLKKHSKTSKLHLLAHMEGQFREEGPFALYSVEVAEHMNGDVRHAVVNSNRQNVSRDTAWDFSVREQVAHLMRGSVDAGSELKTLSGSRIVRRTLRLDKRKDPVKRKRVGEYVFVRNWTEIGLIRSIGNDGEISVEMMFRIGCNCWGAQTY